ncbi:hypothetical protein, partial [Algoriella sp.]
VPFLLFGLLIGVFQTFILKDIWRVNIRPKWLIIVLTPLIIIITDYFFDDQITAFVFFGSMASIFLLAISGLIFQSGDESDSETSYYRNRKSYDEVVRDIKQPVYLNPIWGIVYQIYVVVMIVMYIFVPKETYNSETGYKLIEQDLILQLLSLFIFTGLSIIILLYRHLDGNTNYIPSIFTEKRLIATPKEKQINKGITFAITLICFIIFCKFCYDRGIYTMLQTIFHSFDSSTILTINTAVIAFIIFNTIILIINPSQVAKRNMLRVVTLIRSAFLSIFISAALVIPLMILEDKFAYFNMSSEIILFLGFNFVLLINEISLFVKYRKGLLD